MKVGDNSIGEVQSLTFQDENPRFGINWLCLPMAWLKHCFDSGDYLQDENLRSLIGRRRRLCTVPFLEASFLESLEFRCYLCGGCIFAARTGIPQRVFYFLFLDVCIRTAVRVLQCCIGWM
jgi:hypothetical protein